MLTKSIPVGGETARLAITPRQAVKETATLQPVDIALLAELQENGRISKNELAYRTGISPPQCSRRLRALREQGIIKGVRAILDPESLNYQILCIVLVKLCSQTRSELEKFERYVEAESCVREAWLISGEADYILKCMHREFREVRDFLLALTSLANVRSIRTSLKLATVVDRPPVPLTPS